MTRKEKEKKELEELYLEKYGREEFERRYSKYVLKQQIRRAILACSVATLITIGALLGKDIHQALDFDETTYTQNEYYEAGYFNAHPLKIAICKQEFTDKQLQVIYSAITELDEIMEGATFEIVDACDISANILISKANLKSQSSIFSVAGNATIYDCNGQIFGTVELNKNLFVYGKSMAKNTIIHEMMHVLGMEHSKKINSIMFPINFNVKPSREDKENLNILFPPENNACEAAEQEK